MAQRDTLVLLARLKLANAQLGGDEIGAFQRRAAIQGLVDFHRNAGFFHHALAQRVDNIELFLPFSDIHQPQFANWQFMITLQESFQ